MEFAENDIITEAVIHDLMFYQKRGQRHALKSQEEAGSFVPAAPEPAGT